MNAGTTLRNHGLTLTDLPHNLHEAYIRLSEIVSLYNKIPESRRKRMYRDLIIKADDAITKSVKSFIETKIGNTEANRILLFEARFFSQSN